MKNYTIRYVQLSVFFAIFIGGLLLCFGSLMLLPESVDVTKLLCIAWVAVWGVIGFLLVKKVALRQLTVTLTPEALVIRPAHSTEEQHILLSQIASYVYNDFNDNKSLHFRLHSGQTVVLKHQGALYAEDDIAALAADFESLRLGTLNNEPQIIAIQREKTFFEKPIGNVAGWLIIILLLYFSWHLLVHGANPKKPAAPFLIYGNGLTYLGAWWNARRARRQG